MKLTSWGKHPVIDAEYANPQTIEQATEYLAKATSVIGRGLGRSYGDSALNDKVLSCLSLNYMESFDAVSGLLVAQAGVSLAEILDAFIPRGWFLPVTPGTKFVTLGGAIASDVHGKDHHVSGTFSQHVAWIDLWTPAKGVVRCSATENADIFHATAGGMGLTGFIIRAALYLKKASSAYISQTMIKTANLDEIMAVFEQYDNLPFSVAWIDCLKSGEHLGRSIFMGGKFAAIEKLPEKHKAHAHNPPKPHALAIPIDFPSFTLNTLSVKAFNALYYGKAPKRTTHNTVSYNSFFYPLDSIHNWNRIYGKRGFTQYQFVIPKESAKEGLPKILSAISASGQGSFLAVLKLFGKQETYKHNISFPMEGYTLALDFAINGKLFTLLDRLDAMVLDCGGRHYLTKDCRLSPDVLKRGYGKALDDFLEIKALVDPQNVFQSIQSHRLNLEA